MLAEAARPIPNPVIDYHAIAPALVLARTIFAALLFDPVLPLVRKWLSMPLAFLVVAGALVSAITLIGTRRTLFGGSYVVDNFAVLFKIFFLAVALVVLLLSVRYFREGRYHQGEYYFLLLSSFMGMLT